MKKSTMAIIIGAVVAGVIAIVTTIVLVMGHTNLTKAQVNTCHKKQIEVSVNKFLKNDQLVKADGTQDPAGLEKMKEDVQNGMAKCLNTSLSKVNAFIATQSGFSNEILNNELKYTKEVMASHISKLGLTTEKITTAYKQVIDKTFEEGKAKKESIFDLQRDLEATMSKPAVLAKALNVSQSEFGTYASLNSTEYFKAVNQLREYVGEKVKQYMENK